MQYEKIVILKDGRPCVIRAARKGDAREVLDVFNRTHAETDFLLSYPGEKSFTVEQEADFLEKMEQNERETELCAVVDGRIVGTAGLNALGEREKTRHRCDFGIGILKADWGNGVGRALTEACVDCARQAGYEQMELEVVAENRTARTLYESLGFTEYGQNPRGFRSRLSGWQELVLMRLEL